MSHVQPDATAVLSRGASPVSPCPACSGDDFIAERHVDDVIFRCVACGAGWRFQLGYAWRVDSPPLAPSHIA